MLLYIKYMIIIWSMLCHIMEQLWPKTWNVLVIFFGFYLVLLVLYVPVHEDHKHVQGWNTTTTTSFPGTRNNNDKHGEKPNNKCTLCTTVRIFHFFDDAWFLN